MSEIIRSVFQTQHLFSFQDKLDIFLDDHSRRIQDEDYQELDPSQVVELYTRATKWFVDCESWVNFDTILNIWICRHLDFNKHELHCGRLLGITNECNISLESMLVILS